MSGRDCGSARSDCEEKNNGYGVRRRLDGGGDALNGGTLVRIRRKTAFGPFETLGSDAGNVRTALHPGQAGEMRDGQSGAGRDPEGADRKPQSRC